MRVPDTLSLPAAPPFPNSRWPVLLYRQALAADAAAMEAAFAASGWGNGWRNGIYDFHHFHSIAHEVLGIAAGRVSVRLGGPAGVDVRLAAGDVIVIPAGVGHCNVGDDGGLLVVGAYPGGGSFDTLRGETLRGDQGGYDVAARRAGAVAAPVGDPLPGQDAVRRLWV